MNWPARAQRRNIQKISIRHSLFCTSACTSTPFHKYTSSLLETHLGDFRISTPPLNRGSKFSGGFMNVNADIWLAHCMYTIDIFVSAVEALQFSMGLANIKGISTVVRS